MKQLSEPTGEGSLTSYVVGFVLSIVFTLSAYALVTGNHSLPIRGIVVGVVCLAIVQFGVQLVFFLHLGRGRTSRWNVVAFLFMLLVLGIVVLGSLWIMHNLDYHHDMTPAETDTYILQDEGVHY